MKTINNQHVSPEGGEHMIHIGITFDDPEDADYEHSVVWTFTTDMNTGPRDARLNVMNIIHKKYSKDISEQVDRENFNREDGSEMLHSHGWSDHPHPPDSTPESVQDRFRSAFGDELADATFHNPSENVEPVEVPVIPANHTLDLFKVELSINGSYIEDLSEDNPLVQDGHFTSHVKDVDTGEILSTSYRISHNMSWWFTPVEEADEARLEIEKCFHKTWDETTTGGFKEEYPRETLVEAYKDGYDTPSMASLPHEIINELARWMGLPLTKRSVEADGGKIPTYVYKCFGCKSVVWTLPIGECPNCSNDTPCRFESVEHYAEHLEEYDYGETAMTE